MEGKIVYFEQPGADNTEEVFRIARKRAMESGIKTIIVATTIGASAVRATEVFKGLKTIVVTHAAGFKGPDTNELSEENRSKITQNGGIILTTTHLFSGVGAAWRKKFNTLLINDIVANTLRMMGQGLKVGIEITVMAADAGLARTDEDVIAIAGTARGSDYAIVLKPVNSGDLFDLRVKEILCKPHY